MGFSLLIPLSLCVSLSDTFCREAMSRDKGLDLVSFTGSCAVGNKVGMLVQERFGECSSVVEWSK